MSKQSDSDKEAIIERIMNGRELMKQSQVFTGQAIMAAACAFAKAIIEGLQSNDDIDMKTMDLDDPQFSTEMVQASMFYYPILLDLMNETESSSQDINDLLGKLIKGDDDSDGNNQ